MDGGKGGGLDLAGLRRQLNFAKQNPVNAALALGPDGKAILLLDKQKQPRALEQMLKQTEPDSRTHRFGTVSVVDDEHLVRFTINKQAGSIARKLVTALKGTGYRKIHVTTGDGDEGERAEEEGDDGRGAEGGQARSSPDAAPAPQASRPAADPAAIAKARLLWTGIRGKVGADLDALHGRVAAICAGQDGGQELAAGMRSHLDTVLQEVDDGLGHALDALAGASAADHAKAAAVARAHLARYAAHIAKDGVIAAIDDNPFRPMAVRQTIATALAAIAKQVR